MMDVLFFLLITSKQTYGVVNDLFWHFYSWKQRIFINGRPKDSS